MKLAGSVSRGKRVEKEGNPALVETTGDESQLTLLARAVKKKARAEQPKGIFPGLTAPARPVKCHHKSK